MTPSAQHIEAARTWLEENVDSMPPDGLVDRFAHYLAEREALALDAACDIIGTYAQGRVDFAVRNLNGKCSNEAVIKSIGGMLTPNALRVLLSEKAIRSLPVEG